MATETEGHAAKFPDGERIDVSREADRRYWCTRFDVSEDELTRAVAHAGERPEDVQRFLTEGPGDTSPSGASHWRATSGL